MDRKEVIEMCMESPLYFSMPPKMRLEFVKGHEGSYSSNGLRENLLIWVKTGSYYSSDPDAFS